MAGRSRQREARASAGLKQVKDTVVFRSDVSSIEVKAPVMRNADKVRDYFSQYGGCEVVFEEHHSIRGGNFDRHTMVIRFKETSIANKVKQKYNGRVLFDARITTSWLDPRQMRELGMPQPGKGKGRGKHSLGRGRGRSSPLYSREDSSSPAAGSRYQSSSSLTSASYSTSGTDTESSVESGSYVPDSPPSITKFQGVTRLEQSSRLSPVSTPVPISPPPRERSPARNRKKSSSSPYSRRHSSLERSDSRTSSRSSKDREKDRETDRQREKTSSPKYSTRLRSKRKLSETDKGASTSTSTESPSRNTRSLRSYGPYSKKYRDDSSDSQSSKGDLKSGKTVFDRLGPTKEQADEIDQIEKYGEAESKEKKSGSSLLSPERKSTLKSPTSDEAKQSSGGSDKEVKMGSEKAEQDSALHKTEKGRSTRGNRPRTRSQSDHSKPKSIQQAVTESSTGDQETKHLPESTSVDTQVKDKATGACSLTTQDKEMESQHTDTSSQEGQLNKEHTQEKAGKEKSDSHQLHHHSSPSATEELDGEKAISRQQTEPSGPEHTTPTPNMVHRDSSGVDRQKSKRQETSTIDYKAMKEAIMQEFDEHADILVTSCKILSTQNLTSQQLVESSLETSLMHLAATFMAKFQERAMAAKASQK